MGLGHHFRSPTCPSLSLLLYLYAEMAEPLTAGKLPQAMLQRVLAMASYPFLSWLLKIG